MALDETRIVLFEKIGFRRNFHIILEEIEFRIGKCKKMNKRCIHVPCRWLRHKMILKILEENGFKIIQEEGGGVLKKISWE